MFDNYTNYNKFIYAFLSAVVIGIGSLVLGLQDDGGLSTIDWLQALIVFIGPFIVLVAPKNTGFSNEIKNL